MLVTGLPPSNEGITMEPAGDGVMAGLYMSFLISAPLPLIQYVHVYPVSGSVHVSACAPIADRTAMESAQSLVIVLFMTFLAWK